jgi:hypothetical protein
MDRRKFNAVCVPFLGALLLQVQEQAQAIALSALTNTDATRGLKTALERGARSAVTSLGKIDGYLRNEKVHIPLPHALNDAADMLRTLGQGQRLDELTTAMNRAAEAAVPLAADSLVDAVRSMNVNDAKKILTGGDTAATSFFAEKTRVPLGKKFLPVVTRTTEKVGLAEKYNQIAAKAADMGLMNKEDASIQQYVTGKTLDGLYFMIGEEEKNIRRDPVGTGSALLTKVFGALQ